MCVLKRSLLHLLSADFGKFFLLCNFSLLGKVFDYCRWYSGTVSSESNHTPNHEYALSRTFLSEICSKQRSESMGYLQADF